MGSLTLRIVRYIALLGIIERGGAVARQLEPDGILHPKPVDDFLEGLRAHVGAVDDSLPGTIVWTVVGSIRILIQRESRHEYAVLALRCQLQVPEQDILLVVQKANYEPILAPRTWRDRLQQLKLAARTGWNAPLQIRRLRKAHERVGQREALALRLRRDGADVLPCPFGAAL